MTFWFDRTPGQLVAQSKEGDPRVDGDEKVLLIGADAPPDWVVIPNDVPELGGRQVRVTGHFDAPCPKCRHEAACLHLELASVELFVSECLRGCGFVFYRLPKEDTDEREETN